MSTHLTFRLPDELLGKLNQYCKENKMTKTETINLAIQKLIVGNGGGNACGQTSSAVVDETYILLRNLYVLSLNFSIKDDRASDALKQIAKDSLAKLNKLKGEK